ncbi:MAG TPA: DUF302 domain-containing protein [Gammaproteobacteria bacterium]|nr:DUF302 domain-containing protein [Gammaproteobacteria bacterium]
MATLRNIFALIGLIVVILIGIGVNRYSGLMGLFTELDPKAGTVYLGLAEKLAKTGNAVEATVWKAPVVDGLSADDVEDVMKSIASEHNIKNVGELPLYKQVAAMSGKPYRYAKIFMFCNALTAAKMMDYSDAYSAYLPCRVSLIEDKRGKLWLYTMNMDMMIYGGKTLPPGLKKEALQVKMIITDILQRGAKGDF